MKHPGKAIGDEPLRVRALLVAAGAIDGRGESDLSPEKVAERAETLETDLEADLGHRHLSGCEQKLRLLDPPAHEVAMRGLEDRRLEAANEMVAREVRRSGERARAQSLRKVVIDEELHSLDGSARTLFRHGPILNDRSIQVKDLAKRVHDRRKIRIGFHEVAHGAPPAAHDLL